MHQNNVIICHYWYFKGIGFKYETCCNGCHDLMKKAMSFNDVAFISVRKCLQNSVLVYEQRWCN